jgi:hypothetical protein
MSQVQHQHMTGWTAWVGFAGFLVGFSGILHILFGLGGVFGQDWYITTTNAAWIFDSSTWGWSMIAGGALLLITSALLLAGNMVGRIVGVILALSSLFMNIALFTAAPVWSTIIIVVDVVVLYAIIAHGGEMKHMEDKV